MNWMKLVKKYLVPAAVITAAVQLIPPFISPYLGMAGQYAGMLAAFLTTAGALIVFEKYIANKVGS